MSDVAGTNGQHNGQHGDLTPCWLAQAARSRSFGTSDRDAAKPGALAAAEGHTQNSQCTPVTRASASSYDPLLDFQTRE